MWRQNCVNTGRYRKTVAEVCGSWCAKNDARTLFPVDTRSDKMTVRKTSVVRLFSDTIVCAFSEAAFGEILTGYDAPRPLEFAISFHRSSCFDHSGAQLNMDQGIRSIIEQ